MSVVAARICHTISVSHFDSVCREITTEDEFVRLQDPWNALHAASSYPSPFCRWEWAWEWWQHFGKGNAARYRLLVVLVYGEDGTLNGLAPFFFPTESGALRLRPLRPLGTRIHCTVDDLTEEPILLLRRGCAAQALSAILDGLLAWPGRGAWDLLHLRQMRAPSDPSLRALWRQTAHRLPFGLLRVRQRQGQTRSLPASWPEFRRSLSRSMRDNVVYYPRLLTREGHVWQARFVRDPEEVYAAASTLIDLHHRRACSGRGPAHTNHLPLRSQQSFLRNVLARLAGQGKAAIALLEVDGVPVAAQSVLEDAGMLSFYYSGFDPVWHRYSPITVLHIALLQDAIGRGLTRVDYLPEAEPWKTRWGTEAEYEYDELSCLSLAPRSLLRSLWRGVIRLQSMKHGSACECGYCTREEWQAAAKAVRSGS